VTIDTGAFVAGVGVLVALDTLSLALMFETYRTATSPDEEAREQAQAAHERLTGHLRRYHGQPVQTAREAYEDEEASHAD